MTNILFRYNQRLLAACVLVASLVSCNKEISDQSPQSVTDENALNATVSTRLLSNLLWADDLEGLLYFFTGVSVQTSTSYGITRTTSPIFEGTRSARFELRASDNETNGGTRAEISFQPATNLNRWYSFAMFAPSAQFKWDDEDDCLIQFHQGNGETPALCLRVREDRIYIRILGVWNDLGAFEKDKWMSYVLHVKHSTGSTGLIELWRNGAKLMERYGANMYRLEDYGDHNPSLKLGIYKSAWNGSSTTETSTRVIYYDDIKIGNEYATYEDMVPVPNIPPPTNTSTTSGLSITSFKLVDAALEKDVMTITNGQTISLSALNLSKVNIRAVTSSTEPGSVKFELSGEQSKTYTDSRAPFALHGDSGYGNFYYGNWYPPEPGTYTLKATPYTSDFASGSTGTSQTITFTIVR